MAIDYKPEQNDYINLTPFKAWLVNQINTWGINNFPFLEGDFDKLTNYGMLMKMMKCLNDVIANENLVEEDMTNLFNAFTELQTYVNDYFNNLDVQEEINNKLDDMAQDGSLTNLIKNYIDPLINEQNTKISSIENEVQTIASGSPAGVYATVSDLTTANPDHNKIYVVEADGNWYFWNSNTNKWKNGGVYQTTQIGNDSVSIQMLDSSLSNKDNYYNNSLIIGDYGISPSINRQIILTYLNQGDVVSVPSNYKIGCNGRYTPTEWIQEKVIETSGYYNIWLRQIENHNIPLTEKIVKVTNADGYYYLKMFANGFLNANVSESALMSSTVMRLQAGDILKINGDFKYNIKEITPETGATGNWLYSEMKNIDYKATKEIVFYIRIVKENNKQFTTADSLDNIIYIEHKTLKIEENTIDGNVIKLNSINVSQFDKETRGMFDTKYNRKNYLYGKKLLAIGDSFVKGHTESISWPEMIGTRNNMIVYNKGVNGCCLADRNDLIVDSIVERIDSIISSVPSTDYIVVYAGHNDSSKNITIGNDTDNVETTFKGAYNIIINKLQNAYPTAKIVLFTPANRMNRELPFVNATIDIAHKYSLPHFNNYYDLGLNFNNPALNNIYEIGDSLHFNSLGLERVSIVYENILQNL